MKKQRKLRLPELLYQALETERGSMQLYRSAIKCAVKSDLEETWGKYLEQTENHEEIILKILEVLRLDSTAETYGRQVVRYIGESLLKAIQKAIEAGDRAAAQLVAAECVVQAETKAQLNWELLGQLARDIDGPVGQLLTEACQQVGAEEKDRLSHTRNWTRELWLEWLGLRPY
jgi:hypothetical protein